MQPIKITDTRPNGDPSLAMIPRIYDFETLQSIFQLQVDRSQGWDEAPLGQACWKLVGFELTVGQAEYKLKIRQENGQPLSGIVVYRHWPGAPQLPGRVRPSYFNHGEGKFSSSVGEVAFGGPSVAGSNGGTDTIWVSASPPGQEPQFSDAVRNLGRHGATGLVPNPIFQYAIQDGSDVVQAEGEYTLSIVAEGQEVGQLSLSQAVAGNNYIVLRQGTTELGRIPWQPPG